MDPLPLLQIQRQKSRPSQREDETQNEDDIANFESNFLVE